MKRRAAAALWAAVLALPGAAVAQSLPTLAPSQALECMTPPAAQRGLPSYPPDELMLKDGARLKVELAFTGPDAAPSVRLLSDTQGLAPWRYLRAIESHVSAFRIPCMPATREPVRIELEYVFTPGDGRKVVASRPVEAADRERRAQLGCLTRITPGQRPHYPEGSQRAGEQGKVLLKLHFESADAEPQASVVASSARRLSRAVLDFAPGYRLPCLTTPPLDAWVLFDFQFVDGQRMRLSDTTLLDFLRHVQQPLPAASFDLHTMKCPFELRLTYWQPHRRNDVGQLDEDVPARWPLIEWLEGLRLKLSSGDSTRILGERTTLTVPCGRIEL